jgi:hypothetical protein
MFLGVHVIVLILAGLAHETKEKTTIHHIICPARRVYQIVHRHMDAESDPDIRHRHI